VYNLNGKVCLAYVSLTLYLESRKQVIVIQFVYRQNNSAGRFIGPKTIAVVAETVEQANELAITQGAYFDGVAKGLDCECCGDRWYRKTEPDFEYLDKQLG
jgi:hypothetical protein